MTVNTFLSSAADALILIKANIKLALIVIGILWGINIINFLLGKPFNYLGIYPRRLFGLIGIPLSPLWHANWDHLFFNSIPLFILLCFLPSYGIPMLITITLVITFISGLATWLFGRKAIHVGASSLIMGYWSFLIAQAYQHPSVMSIVMAILTLYYLGGLFFNLFPQSEKVSWEGHLFGFAAGIVAAFLPLQGWANYVAQYMQM